jgi:response regulator RpfG family c-di-GMP phosphodiesterase
MTNLIQVLKWAKLKQIGLVIADFVMPEQFVQAIHQPQPFNTLAMITITIAKDKDKVLHIVLIVIGATVCLTEPVTASHLKKMVIFYLPKASCYNSINK